VLSGSLAPPSQHLVPALPFFLVQLKFLTHRIAFCSAFSGGSEGSTRAIASSIRKKLVLKIKQDENKNE